MDSYFKKFRNEIIGDKTGFSTPYGKQRILYADWIASGRLYRPIEEIMFDRFGPFVANTHTETNVTGTSMTQAYHYAQHIIKKHVNASGEDIIILSGSGMTGVINKLIRILGLRVPEKLKSFVSIPDELRPVVFLTHMEHHSNQTPWLETIADVVVLHPDGRGLVTLESLEQQLEKYKDRKWKIGSFTACSNVTGIRAPYHKMAKLMHQYEGFCFVDYAAGAPYLPIDMHPDDPGEQLDAVFFSPHKFLGGPGTPGVIVFNKCLYKLKVPDQPGGGTVDWTNPWGEHRYVADIEAREAGGTPPFLQTIKAALAVNLKEEMGCDKMIEAEEKLVPLFMREARKIKRLHLLADHIEERIGAISLYFDDIHYNLIVKLLNDRFGIQVRGGCSCAGTYGHYLLNVDYTYSHEITALIDKGDLSKKPGWVRFSLHPTMTEDEVLFMVDALSQIEKNIDAWGGDYSYSSKTNEFFYNRDEGFRYHKIEDWFKI